MSYSLVHPAQFTEKQKRFIERFCCSIAIVSSRSRTIVGAKDIESRHLVSTDAYAQIVGLTMGGDVTGRFDRDMPCQSTAQFADCFVREDRTLLSHRDPKRTTSVLNMHEYSNGLKTLVFDKLVLKHHPSKSILGTIYAAYEIDMSRFFSLLPTYTFEFGLGCSIERTDGRSVANNVVLTDFEHEIAFMLAINWTLEQITDFVKAHRPQHDTVVISTIRAISEKLCGEFLGALQVRDKLVELRVHQKMPRAFFNHIIGACPL
jgi:hypothetical protein